MLSWLRRLTAVARQRRLDDELADEIDLHIDLRRQALIDEGMDPHQAEYEARRRFGNPTVTRERTRDERSFPTLTSFAQDLRFASRLMRRSPGHSAAVILTIALGTGLNGAVFVLFNAAFLRPPDVPHIEEVVRLDDGKPFVGPTYPDYVDYRDRGAAALDLAAYAGMRATVRIGRADSQFTENVTAVLASGNYFDVLKVPALHGRTFDGREDLPPTGTPVVVLGEAYWTRRFNRDPSIIGQAIDLNFQRFTIVGIVPATFKGVEIAGGGTPSVREMYVPLWCLPLLQPRDTRLLQRTTWWGLQAVGRLRPGVTVAQARARVESIAASLNREYAGLRAERVPSVAPIAGVDIRLLKGEAGLVAAVVGTATLLVLLVACANVANLVLARACARSREIAVRLSLGAGRWRIVRQFLTESLVVSSCGTLLGFAMAHWALGVATASPDAQPFSLSLSPDTTVVLYAAMLAALVAGVTGFVPALQASKPGILPALKAPAGSSGLGRLRATFVGAEVAICLVLLVSTAMMLRGAQRARAIDPIIPVANLLAVGAADSSLHGYTAESQAALLGEIEQRIAALPGVTTTALANPVPFSGNRHGTTLRRSDAADGPGLRVFTSNVSPSFFQAANLRLVRGRVFDARSTDEVIVNQAVAARLWGSNGTDDPIGQRLTSGDFERRTHIIVGVVADAPFVSLRLRDEPFMFRPIDPAGGGTVIARTSGPAGGLARAATEVVRAVDPRLEAVVEAVADGIEGEVGAVRNGAGVAAGLGVLALLLALFGVAAVTANSVVQRTHEIGIRMALGATASDATALVVRQSTRAVIGGIVLGLLGAALVARIIASQLYGLSSLDPLAFGAASAFLAGAATIAAWFPARRAARVDPLIALRAE